MNAISPSLIVAFFLTFAANELITQKGKGGTLSGGDEAVDGNDNTVNHRRESKTFTLHDKTKIAYVSFLEAKKEIKRGFFVRATVDSKGQCHQIWVTLSPPAAPVQGRLQGPPAKSKFLAVSDQTIVIDDGLGGCYLLSLANNRSF